MRRSPQGNHVGIRFYYDTIPEARDHLARTRQTAKELRYIKRDGGLTKRNIQSSFIEQKGHVGKGVGSALIGGLLDRKTMGKINVVRREWSPGSPMTIIIEGQTTPPCYGATDVKAGLSIG
jgi:hypothetical protein